MAQQLLAAPPWHAAHKVLHRRHNWQAQRPPSTGAAACAGPAPDVLAQAPLAAGLRHRRTGTTAQRWHQAGAGSRSTPAHLATSPGSKLPPTLSGQSVQSQTPGLAPKPPASVGGALRRTLPPKGRPAWGGPSQPHGVQTPPAQSASEAASPPGASPSPSQASRSCSQHCPGPRCSCLTFWLAEGGPPGG